MNNLLTFILAPVTAFFMPQVYCDAARSSAGRGVLYIFYITLISTIILLAIGFATAMPQVNRFADWAKKAMPVIIWTPDGVSLENGQSTYEMNYPDYGPVVLFDLEKTAVTEQDMGKAFVFVTKTRVFLKKGAQQGALESRLITKEGIQSKEALPARVRIDSQLAGGLFENIKKIVIMVVPFVVLFMFFIFNLIITLLWSLFGLLLNLFRKTKLGYGAIFNLACFAQTAAAVLGGLALMTPIARPRWLGILVDVVYMVFAFKVSDQATQEDKA